MSQLAKLPTELRPIVMDFVGHRMYPPLSINIQSGPGSVSYTVSIYEDLFKIDREGLDFKPFFVPSRDHLVEVLHRSVYACLEEDGGYELACVHMEFNADYSTIYAIDEMPNGNYEIPDDKLDVLKSLTHMVGLLGVICIII